MLGGIDTKTEVLANNSPLEVIVEKENAALSMQERRNNFKLTDTYNLAIPKTDKNILTPCEKEAGEVYGRQNYPKERRKRIRKAHRQRSFEYLLENYDITKLGAHIFSVMPYTRKYATKALGPSEYNDFVELRREWRQKVKEFFIEYYHWPDPKWGSLKKHPKLTKKLDKYLNITTMIASTIGLPNIKENGKKEKHNLSDYVGAYFVGSLPIRYVEAFSKVTGKPREFYTDTSVKADPLLLGFGGAIAGLSYLADVHLPNMIQEIYNYFGAKNLFDGLVKWNVYIRAPVMTFIRMPRHFIFNKHTPSPAGLVNAFIPEMFGMWLFFGHDYHMRFKEWRAKRSNKYSVPQESSQVPVNGEGYSTTIPNIPLNGKSHSLPESTAKVYITTQGTPTKTI